MWGRGGGDSGSAVALATEYFTQRIEDGASLGHIVYEAIHYLQGDPLPVFADTVQLLNNKVLVASTHAESYENIASVEEGISLLIGVISDKIYTLEEVLTFLTEKLEGNTGDGDGNGDGDTPPPPPPPAPTFRVNEADGEVTFSGTAAGNITFTTDSENVATFTRGGITATTKPDLDDITKVTLSSSQTLTGSAADLAKIEAIEGTGNLIITGAPTVAAINAINFSGVEGTVTYNLFDTLENLASADDGVVSGADSYSLTDATGVLEDLTVAEAVIVAGASNAEDYTYSLSDTLANLEGANADVIDDAESYAIHDIATVFQNVAVAGLPTEAQQALIDDASNKDDFAYSLTDTLENLAAADEGVVSGADSYEISDIDTVFQNVAVAGLPTEAQQALIDDASNKDDFAYSLSDTLENLAGAEDGVVSGADSYSLTNEPGTLTDLTIAEAVIVAGASNAEDYPYSLSDEEGALTNLTVAEARAVVNASNAEDYTYSIEDTWENISDPAAAAIVEDADGYEISDIATVFQNVAVAGLPTEAQQALIDDASNKDDFAYSLSDTLENLAGAEDGVVSGADSYEISDIDTVFQNVAVAGLPTEAQQALIDDASNKDDFAYSLSDTLENLAGAEDGVVSGADSYSLTDEAGVLEDISVAAAEILVDASNAGDYTYSLSDTLENLEGADADVIDDAESYEISDIDTVFQNVAVAGLPTEAQQALIDEASNKDDFGYSLSDTLENLEGADADIIDGATSYTLTDEAGVLEDISVAAAEILVDASNAGDYTYSIDDTAAAIDDANANILNGATAITATGTDGDDDIDLSNNLDGPVTTGVTIDLGDGNDIFVGGNGDDVITSGNGNNVITGGIGNDTITLGEGDDIIVYNNVVTEGGDTIHSFTVGTDKLQFSDADLKGVVNFAAYSGDGAAVTLNDDIKVEFVSNTGENLVASAAEAAFLFDTETGTLSYDADGTGDGEAIIVATLVGVDNLSADDFTFIV